jgi:hypothetical protein
MSYLLNSLSPDILAHTVGLESSAQVWSKINTMFSTASRSKVNHLRDALNSTKKLELSATAYFAKMKGFCSELTAMGKPVDDDELVGYICRGLDGSYNDVVSAINGNPSATLDDLFDQISAHDIRQAHLQASGDSYTLHANLTRRGRDPRGGPDRDRDRTDDDRGRRRNDGGRR